MIRNAAEGDLDSILAIEESCFSKPWTKKSFESELFRARNLFLVYEKDGRVAGYIVFWYILDEAEIADIAVSAEYRRNCIAEQLIRKCISERTEINIVHLEVGVDNLAAIGLYKKIGFSENGKIKDYYGHGKDALRMSLLTAEYRGDRDA